MGGILLPSISFCLYVVVLNVYPASNVWVDVWNSSCLVLQWQSAEVSRTVTSSFEWSQMISVNVNEGTPRSWEFELNTVHLYQHYSLLMHNKLQYTWHGDYCECEGPAKLPILTRSSNSVPHGATSTIRSPSGPCRIQHRKQNGTPWFILTPHYWLSLFVKHRNSKKSCKHWVIWPIHNTFIMGRRFLITQFSYQTKEHKTYLSATSILNTYTLFIQLAGDGYKEAWYYPSLKEKLRNKKKKQEYNRNSKRQNFPYTYMHCGN